MEHEKERIVAIIAAVGAVVGAFLPWETVLTAFGRLNVNGIDGGRSGVITAGIGVLTVIFLALEREKLWPAMTAGAGGLVITVIGFDQLSSSRDAVTQLTAEGQGLAHASTGAGLYVTIAAGLLLIACAFFAYRRDRALYYF